jgi:ABC-type phosphate transport system ATPase subunit
MLDGKLIEYARASAFFESPVDPRTSAFIRGDMIF